MYGSGLKQSFRFWHFSASALNLLIKGAQHQTLVLSSDTCSKTLLMWRNCSPCYFVKGNLLTITDVFEIWKTKCHGLHVFITVCVYIKRFHLIFNFHYVMVIFYFYIFLKLLCILNESFVSNLQHLDRKI